MLQDSNLTIGTAVANQSGAMEADTISKNGRSLKSHTSRGNFLIMLLSIFFTGFIFLGCKKDDDKDDIDKNETEFVELEEFGYDGDMPDELLDFFASLPKYNGAGFNAPMLRSTKAGEADKLSEVFMGMISDAIFLSTYAPPGQEKLVYKWGSKDPDNLSVASPKYNKDGTIRPGTPICTDKVYGLDCSGLIYQLFKYNNVPLNNNNLKKQYVAEQINGIMKMKTVQDINVKARKLEIGKVSVANLKTGDIIYYVGDDGVAYHIGMFYKENDNQVVLFHSTGSWSKTCEQNASENNGVVGVTMNNAKLGEHLMKYKKKCNIIRIEAEPEEQGNLCIINGNWSGSQNGSFTTSASGIPSQTTPIDGEFGFVVENCKIQAGSYQVEGMSMSFDGSMTGNNVKIYLTTTGSGINQKWTYMGQLNGSKNKISGTWTLSASYDFAVGVTQSGSGTWEVTK